ncbi:phosphopantetheine-binding protein [Pseudomonas aeruginosa]|nr:phosphopantetheine-binding protein [Pseudomonas aeruginosa]
MRGHRIELGEIEAALSALPGVARAVAVTIGKPVALAAAFVPTDPTTQPRTDELLAALRQLLPDYMVPTHLQAIDTLPLSGNGRSIDRPSWRCWLPKPRHERPTTRHNQVWSARWPISGGGAAVHPLSRTDDFFLIGGDSLRATQIVQLLHSRRISPAPVPLFVLFSSPTIAALAHHIRGQWQAPEHDRSRRLH